jgi:ABC-type hemin transport system ATPase subunit
LGPNGAGKSTLLQLVTGLLKPVEGTVKVFDENARAGPAQALARVGFVAQEHPLYPGFSVADLVLDGDHDGAAQGDAGQYTQCGGGNSHATVTDRMTEHTLARPAVEGDRAGSAPEGVKACWMRAQRKDQWAEGRMDGW